MHDPQRRQGPGSVGALAEAESRKQHGKSITASISTTPNTDPREEFRAAIVAAGLTPPDTIVADGKLHRFASNGKRGDTAGYYVLHDDEIPAGMFGDWRTGHEETWRADPGRALTAEEKAEQRRRIEAASAAREAAEKAMHAEAAERAQDEWKAAPAADDQHPYLQRKRVKAHGLRVDDKGRLLVPVRDSAGRLTSLQRIGPDGEKRFLPGGQVAGGYFSIGTPRDTVCIAEGYATAASIHEATGHAVAVAFNAGNLLPVARAMREKYPAVKLIVCGDDDAGTPGNPGLTKAREAAQAVGALLAIPDFGADRPEGATDFNDMATHRGAEAVRLCIERAREDMVSANAAQSASQAVEIGSREGPLHVEIIDASTLRPEPIRWLWAGWLARGKLHVLAGAPGTGKTTIAVDIASAITSGRLLPTGYRPERARVLIWSGEDDHADTLLPRLIAAGADLSRVQFVGQTHEDGERRPFDPARDVPLLAHALSGHDDVRLIIVDPLVNAVHGDSHKNAEVRRGLAPLVELAGTVGAALLGITHYSKGTQGREPLERVTGSLAFGALARIVLGTVRQKTEEGEPQRLLLARCKSNIGPDGGGFTYAMESVQPPEYPGVEAPRIAWGAAVEGSARELMAEAEADVDADDDRDDAEAFLRALLTDGPMPAKDVYREAESAGYSRDQMKRAKVRSGAVAVKVGGYFSDGKQQWVWRLAAEGSGDPLKGAHKKGCSLQQEPLPSGETEVLEL